MASCRAGGLAAQWFRNHFRNRDTRAMLPAVTTRRTLLIALAALALCGMASLAAAAPRTPAWQVYALRYGTVNAFPVHELVAGADTTRTTDIAMMFWLLKGPGGR